MTLRLILLALVALLAGCAALTRPMNPPITEVHPTEGYRFVTREAKRPGNNDKDTLVPTATAAGSSTA
jgi:hypothetical protein